MNQHMLSIHKLRIVPDYFVRPASRRPICFYLRILVVLQVGGAGGDQAAVATLNGRRRPLQAPVTNTPQDGNRMQELSYT